MDNKSIYSMVLESDDIRWQTIIYDLIRTGKVDPWDIDISTLAKEYTKVLKNLERMNFRMCGKVVLAAALLLKIKTRNLGLRQFLELTEAGDENFDEKTESEEQDENKADDFLMPQIPALELAPKLDQQRTRKVTVFELMGALKKAMDREEQLEKKLAQQKQDTKQKPKKPVLKGIDIYRKIRQVYVKLKMLSYRTKKNVIDFHKLIPSTEKKDIVWTFLPLLHLSNEQKVFLHQEEPFGKIFVEINKQPLEFKKIETNESQVNQAA